jgi:hypothetical protein
LNNAGKMVVPFPSGQIIAIFWIIADAIRHSGWVLSVGYVLLFYQIHDLFSTQKPGQMSVQGSIFSDPNPPPAQEHRRGFPSCGEIQIVLLIVAQSETREMQTR